MADKETNPQKKKIMIGVIVLIALVMGWQIFGMFGGSSEETPPVLVPPKNSSAVRPTTPAMSTNAPGTKQTTGFTTAAPTPTSSSPATNPIEPKPSNMSVSSDLLKMEREYQEAYIKQLNQLQMLKLEKEIAELNRTLASTKLATMASEKSIAELITAKVPRVTPPPPELEGPKENTPPTTVRVITPPPPPPPEEMPEIAYSLLSVSFKAGKWQAVLGSGDKLFNVSVGDSLPLDNSVVISINKNSVMLLDKSGKKKRKILFNVTI